MGKINMKINVFKKIYLFIKIKLNFNSKVFPTIDIKRDEKIVNYKNIINPPEETIKCHYENSIVGIEKKDISYNSYHEYCLKNSRKYLDYYIDRHHNF